MTCVSSSRFVHPRLLLASLLPSHVSSISISFSLSSHPFLFPYLVLIFPRMLFAHSNSIYERTLFRILSFRRTSGIATEANAEDEGTEIVCHSSLSSPISWQFHVVHKLSPSRARHTKVAVLTRHCCPYGKEGDGAREWRRCRLIFSHRINPAPASRRGLILHVAEDLVCQGNMREFPGARCEVAGIPTQRPTFILLIY